MQLPEQDRARVSVGHNALLEGAYDEATTAMATVERIAPAVDPTTGTVKVTIKLAPDQNTLRPGQFVKVRLETDRHDNVLTIPRRALVYDEGEPVAWRVIDAPAPEAKAEPTDDAAAAGEAEPSLTARLAALF